MNVEVWESSNGDQPVKDFIARQEPKIAQRLIKDVQHLEEHGMKLITNPKKLKKFSGQNSLYELRRRFAGTAYRIIFTEIKGTAWLLLGFIKKSDATPPRLLKTARERRDQLRREILSS